MNIDYNHSTYLEFNDGRGYTLKDGIPDPVTKMVWTLKKVRPY